MKIFKIEIVLALLLAMLVPLANGQVAGQSHKAAIFVINHANKSLDEKLPTLEDLMTAPLTEKGYGVISQEATTTATSSFQKQNPDTTLDQALASSTSATRLAQMLNADYLMLVSITSFGSEEKKTVIGGDVIDQTIHTLRVTYKLTDNQGTTLASEPVAVTDTTTVTTGTEVQDTDIINRLLEKAANAIATKIPPPPTIVAQNDKVGFTVVCGIADAGGQTLSLPDIRLAEDGTIVVEKTPAPVLAVNASVELDGAVIGSTPDQFHALPGLHKMKITHEQCVPWERTANISAGQKLKVVLQMTETAYQRWKDQTAFLQTLENGKKLTDAEVERVKGLAQMLKQSGTKVDVTVNTKEGLKVYKSIY